MFKAFDIMQPSFNCCQSTFYPFNSFSVFFFSYTQTLNCDEQDGYIFFHFI